MSMTERLAELFSLRPNEWIDGHSLGHVAGGYAWRTRVSELRHAPFNMTIENRQRVIDTQFGKRKISEYRYLKVRAAADAGTTSPDVEQHRPVAAQQWRDDLFQMMEP